MTLEDFVHPIAPSYYPPTVAFSDRESLALAKTEFGSPLVAHRTSHLIDVSEKARAVNRSSLFFFKVR